MTKNSISSPITPINTYSQEDIDEGGDDEDYEDVSTYEDDLDTNISDDEIDNTDINYSGRNICIKLNINEVDCRNRVKKSEHVFCDRFPQLKEISSGNRMQNIIDGLFPESFSKQMCIRNLAFTDQSGSDVKVLGIRIERTPGDFLQAYVPNEVSFMFKGYISGKVFIFNSIYEVADTEQLDFEVDVVATHYKNPEMVRGANFLYDIPDSATSLTKYISERLHEWKECVDSNTHALTHLVNNSQFCGIIRAIYDVADVDFGTPLFRGRVCILSRWLRRF